MTLFVETQLFVPGTALGIHRHTQAALQLLDIESKGRLTVWENPNDRDFAEKVICGDHFTVFRKTPGQFDLTAVCFTLMPTLQGAETVVKLMPEGSAIDLEKLWGLVLLTCLPRQCHQMERWCRVAASQFFGKLVMGNPQPYVPRSALAQALSM